MIQIKRLRSLRFFFYRIRFFFQFDMRRFFMHQLFDFFQFQSYDFFLFSIVALSLLKDQMMQNQKLSKKMMILQRFFTLDKSIVYSNQKVGFANSLFSIKFSIKLNVIMISVVAYHFFLNDITRIKITIFFLCFCTTSTKF